LTHSGRRNWFGDNLKSCGAGRRREGGGCSKVLLLLLLAAAAAAQFGEGWRRAHTEGGGEVLVFGFLFLLLHKFGYFCLSDTHQRLGEAHDAAGQKKTNMAKLAESRSRVAR